MIAYKLELNEDLGSAPKRVADLRKLQAKDFAKWVRKQVRLNGRKAEICTTHKSAIDFWLEELGVRATFLCGGEIEINGQVVVSNWTNIGYYFITDEVVETKASTWLEIAESECQNEYFLTK